MTRHREKTMKGAKRRRRLAAACLGMAFAASHSTLSFAEDAGAAPPTTPPAATVDPSTSAPAAKDGREAAPSAQDSLETIVQSAQNAAADATKAATFDDASNGLDRAKAQKRALAGLPDSANKEKAVADVDKAVKNASDAVDKKRADESLCGSTQDQPRSFCFVYGLFAASLSIVRVAGEGTGTAGVVSGQSNHHLASIAVPFAGFRVLPQVWFGANRWGFVSLDIGGYSAFLTQNLTSSSPGVTKSSCSTNGGDFERKLPCEANAVIQPYVGAYVGLTVGKTGLAYVTLAPFTIGVAQVGTLPELRVYSGWTIGAIQLNGNL